MSDPFNILLAVSTLFITTVGIGISWLLSSTSLILANQANDTNKLVAFETSFFNLLKAQSDIVTNMTVGYRFGDGGIKTDIVARGHNCFRSIYGHVQHELFDVKRRKLGQDNPMGSFTEEEIDSVQLSDDEIIDSYMSVYNDFQGELGHYFRNLYHIVRFVNETKMISDKKKYTRLIRAQLSAYELSILAYNCLSKYGVEKFRPLIIEYRLLRNMNWDLFQHQSLRDKYAPLN